ncbi:MAG TPA: thioredoxin domain-containing protein [Thermoanaerobaculia bacterium]|nr:thioredoxin domain-containing protein [Thermoanaerobaculia bacterium]
MKRTLLLLTLFLAVPLFADTITFTVIGIDCDGCAKPILGALRGVDGVKSAKLDWQKGIASVDAPADFNREKLRTALTDLGFEAVFPGETRKDIEPLAPEVLKTLDIQTDAKGAKIDAGKIVAAGKITIVDFYADWCGPCKVLEMRLHNFMSTHPGLALRRVNVGKWDTPAAVQATREFHAEALPYIRVYDAKGKFVASITGGMWDQVLQAIDKVR